MPLFLVDSMTSSLTLRRAGFESVADGIKYVSSSGIAKMIDKKEHCVRNRRSAKVLSGVVVVILDVERDRGQKIQVMQAT